MIERFQDEQELLDCLREVPEPFRAVVQLCDIEELDYATVAGMLQVPVGTVKSRHARGRIRLRQSVQERRSKNLPPSASPRGET